MPLVLSADTRIRSPPALDCSSRVLGSAGAVTLPSAITAFRNSRNVACVCGPLVRELNFKDRIGASSFSTIKLAFQMAKLEAIWSGMQDLPGRCALDECQSSIVFRRSKQEYVVQSKFGQAQDPLATTSTVVSVARCASRGAAAGDQESPCQSAKPALPLTSRVYPKFRQSSVGAACNPAAHSWAK